MRVRSVATVEEWGRRGSRAEVPQQQQRRTGGGGGGGGSTCNNLVVLHCGTSAVGPCAAGHIAPAAAMWPIHPTAAQIADACAWIVGGHPL